MSSQEGAAAVAHGSCAMNTASVKPVPEGFSCVSEGSASIIHETGHVFYNPAQVQNRDLSIACLNVFSKIYRLEKEVRAAKRSSRHAADNSAAIASSPVVAIGKVAPEETAVEYKGLRILEGLSLSPIFNYTEHLGIHYLLQAYLRPVCARSATRRKFQI